MPSPCEHKEVVAMIREDLKDFKKETKENFSEVKKTLDILVAFKDKLIGIQIVVSTIATSVIAFLAWIISIIVK